MGNHAFSNIDRSTTSADPWSDLGYSEWQQDSARIRREWMRMMGMSEDDIEESLRSNPPSNLDDELAEYNAMFEIQKLQSRRD